MGNVACRCTREKHDTRLVVITGGPGGGKTAVLEVVQRHFCEHVVVLPEAASILFKGGFPRRESPEGQRAVQRAIYRVQVEMERLALAEGNAAVVLCDRGTVDGLAYWPSDEETYWGEFGTSRDAQLRRYASVIHLHTPSAQRGYNHTNPERIESARAAMQLDRRIEHAWDGHPDRHFVSAKHDFLEKVTRTLALIREHMPPCCAPFREGEGEI